MVFLNYLTTSPILHYIFIDLNSTQKLNYMYWIYNRLEFINRELDDIVIAGSNVM